MQLWTVVRFPNGSWSYGGRPDSPEYAQCEVWEIEAETPTYAINKAQGHWRRKQKSRTTT